MKSAGWTLKSVDFLSKKTVAKSEKCVFPVRIPTWMRCMYKFSVSGFSLKGYVVWPQIDCFLFQFQVLQEIRSFLDSPAKEA